MTAQVLKSTEQPDLALLKVDGWGWDYLCVDNEGVVETQHVAAVGFPGGQMLSFDRAAPSVSIRGGQVTAIRHRAGDKIKFFEHSAPIEQGSSGGALVNHLGIVVGVNTFLSGPQMQSRFAISAGNLRHFLVQEAAEGKGAFIGPSKTERYVIMMARVALCWGDLDRESHQIHEFSFTPCHWSPPGKTRPRLDAIRIAEDVAEGISHLIAAVNALQPPSHHRLSHTKVSEALMLQLRGLETSIRLMRDHTEDRYVELGRVDERDDHDKESEFGQQINVLQEGRTRLCFAFNRIIGKIWAVTDEANGHHFPVHIGLGIGDDTPESERTHINELASPLLRHKGERVVIFRIESGPWKRPVVFGDGLVTGSDAMYRELRQVAARNQWGDGSESMSA